MTRSCHGRLEAAPLRHPWYAIAADPTAIPMVYAHEPANHLLDPNDTADVQIVREALAAKVAGEPNKGLGHTLALLLISLFLFWTLEGATTDGTATWIGALVLVLAVHEAGHFIAMKVFGYTDLKVFFIPLVGAAASGRKIDATPTQRALVSLMGPLPGIVLAFAASFLAPYDSQLVAEVVVLALAINASTVRRRALASTAWACSVTRR